MMYLGVCFIQGLSARKRASGDEIVHFQRHGASDSYWQFKYDNEPEIWYRRMLNGDRVWQNTEKQKKSEKAHKPAKVYPGHGGGFAHAPMRYRTLPHTKGVLSECGKTEKSMWDVLRLLMEPEQRSVLIDDVMTPYMRFKLLYSTKAHIGFFRFRLDRRDNILHTRAAQTVF